MIKTVDEEEVVCGVIKWLIDQQNEWNENNAGIKMGFWLDNKSFRAGCNFLMVDENIEDFKNELSNRFGFNRDLLDECLLGVEDFKIPWYGTHNLIPDIMIHNYFISDAYSETWAIECKGDDLNSIKSCFTQVIGHGAAVAQSFIALAKEEVGSVEKLKGLGYGVLSYDSETLEIIKDGEVQTRANPELLNYFNKYLRDLHLKRGQLPIIFESPFVQRRIALKTNLSLALHIYYNQELYQNNPIDEARSFLGNVSSLQQHIDDLRNMELIDNNFQIPNRAISFFNLLETKLEGITNDQKIQFFINNFPSIQSNRILYQENRFGFFIANLLKIFITSNNSIKEFIGWILQATQEVNGENPKFAHVITVGIKQNPILITEMFLHKRSDNIPSFHFNITRPKPNACASCQREDKIEFCFCGGEEGQLFRDSFSNITERVPFQERYNEFFQIWSETIPIELFRQEDLRQRYIKVFEYDNGGRVEILAPCFIKCLIHTNINKTTALLKHIGILGEEVRSGLKAELCPRFDVLNFNDTMEEPSA